MSTENTSIVLGDRTVFASFRLLEAYASRAGEHVQKQTRKQLSRALKDYPELAGKTINVGRLKPNATTRDGDTAVGRAHGWTHLIALPPEYVSRNVTVWHELTHVAIWAEYEEQDADHPRTSEPYCSIQTIARMDPALIDDDRIAYLGEPSVPVDHWPAICRGALDYRNQQGPNSHYIKQCKEHLGIE